MGGKKLILVDYLQVFADQRKNETEYSAVSFASGKLRQLALQLKVHIMAASSLNRREAGADGRLGLHSLRSSGQTGHDAAVVLLLSGEQCDEEEMRTRERLIQLEIAKNRTGARGLIRFRYHLANQRMEEEVQ